MQRAGRVLLLNAIITITTRMDRQRDQSSLRKQREQLFPFCPLSLHGALCNETNFSGIRPSLIGKHRLCQSTLV